MNKENMDRLLLPVRDFARLEEKEHLPHEVGSRTLLPRDGQRASVVGTSCPGLGLQT